MLKRILKIIIAIIAVLIAAAVAFVLFLTVTEYKPEATQELEISGQASQKALSQGDSISILSWNTGYGGLGQGADFFMDGGSGVRSSDKSTVLQNMESIAALSSSLEPDFYLFQEVDSGSKRTYGIDEREYLDFGVSAYALNYSCKYVPYPLPTIGRVNSGIFTVSTREISSAQRISLPCPFSWPVSVANLKRCLLVSRIDLDGTDSQLVLINLHLEAYDDGEGKAAQTAMLKEIIEKEYANGNYVIAGGDFNQSFPDALTAYPVKDPSLWSPGVLEEGSLAEGWQYAYDLSAPSCRLLNQPYDPDSDATQYYVIDGFILSPNVELKNVETLDAGFVSSDHNPVLLNVTLK